MVASHERQGFKIKYFRPWEHSASSDSEHTQECCGRKFSQDKSREYYRHINKTSKHCRQTEKCPDCGKQFTRKDNLTRHRKMKHESDSKPECAFCHKQLSRKDAVQRHEGTCHNNPKKQNSPRSPSIRTDSSSADSYYHKPDYEPTIMIQPYNPLPLTLQVFHRH